MKVKTGASDQESPDLTPMIDMTFQLIAFFMILLNFSAVDRNEDIELPLSELAKPPKEVAKHEMVLNLLPNGEVLYSNTKFSSGALLDPLFKRKVQEATRNGATPADVKIVIRASEDVATGKVQELMAECEKHELTNFALRVKERVLGTQ